MKAEIKKVVTPKGDALSVALRIEGFETCWKDDKSTSEDQFRYVVSGAFGYLIFILHQGIFVCQSTWRKVVE